MSQTHLVEHTVHLECEGGLCYSGRGPARLTFGGKTKRAALKVAAEHGWLVTAKRVLCPWCAKRAATDKRGTE